MKFKCYNYKSINDLVEYVKIDLSSSDESIFKNSYIITATHPMSDVLCKIKEFECISFKSINVLLKDLLPGWYDDKTLLEQYVLLDEIVKEYANFIAVNGYCKLASSMRKNRNEIAKSVRLLLEAELLPDRFDAVNEEEKAFLEIYRQFVERCGSTKEFCQCVESWEDSRVLKAMLRLCNFDCNKCSKVFFQGFYYITPLQERLFKAMSQIGIEISFLNNYDSDVSEVYRIWEYNELFKDTESINIISQGEQNIYFTEVFTGKFSKSMPIPNVNITEFADIFSCVKIIGAKGLSKSKIFSTDTEELGRMIETFFPTASKKGQLLSYPMGQYLMSLYKMWDTNNHSVKLEVDNIRFALSTGWAGSQDDFKPSDLELFDKIAYYFTDCITLDEWENRANLLKAINEQIVPLFVENNDSSRWPLILGNPLLPYGGFSNDMLGISRIINMLKDICGDCRIIFDNNGKVDLTIHFKNIIEIVSKKRYHKKISKDELIIVEESLFRLKQASNDAISCNNDTLAEAMLCYLGGTLKEVKDSAVGLLEDDGPICELSNIEAISYGYQEDNFYLCFCDNQRMPGSERSLPWPLNEKLITRSKNKYGAQSFHYLNNYIGIIKNNGLISRYLFYLAIQIENINISWVSELDAKVLSCSPYLQILMDRDLYNIKRNTGSKYEEDFRKSKNIVVKDFGKYDDYKVGDVANDEQPAEIILNRKLCPFGNLRNIYDYGLQLYPSFKNEFHTKFYTENLLKIMKNNAVTRLGDANEAAKELFAILPMYDQIHRSEILDGAAKYGLKSLEGVNSSYNGLNYQADRLYIKYLRGDVLDKIYNGDGKPPDGFDSCIYCTNADSCYMRYRRGVDSE